MLIIFLLMYIYINAQTHINKKRHILVVPKLKRRLDKK